MFIQGVPFFLGPTQLYLFLYMEHTVYLYIFQFYVKNTFQFVNYTYGPCCTVLEIFDI